MNALLLLALAAAPSAAETRYELVSSTLTYHISHLVHKVSGTSRSARGKGACAGKSCEFLVGVPVASFDSGDSNRDHHMVQTVKGGQHPMIAVRTKLADDAAAPLKLDLEVEFAGAKKTYAGVEFARSEEGGVVRLSGKLPLVLTDFGIERPSFLGVPIKDEAPVDVEAAWVRR